uniref:Uncharacterized protein n=1 Tax=Anguilla anguilla TaxID=7936 RepID=A0A0E9TD34_ANGAN
MFLFTPVIYGWGASVWVDHDVTLPNGKLSSLLAVALVPRPPIYSYWVSMFPDNIMICSRQTLMRNTALCFAVTFFFKFVI